MSDKIYVTKSSMPPFCDFTDEIRDLWESCRLTNMGAKHKKLEEELEKYLRVKHVSLMVNGHMALELALSAMHLSGEVITTPFTFASTTHAIVRNGLTPVFCDIDPGTYTIDAEKIESLITDRTCAILPVHVYGSLCDVEKIQEIARKYRLKVLYDAAHAFGEDYQGIGVGSFGDASVFSFHATKVFHTIEGGAVCFADGEYGTDLYRLKNFGIRGPEKVDYIGANAKMNEFQAAMGLCNLRWIDLEIEKRKRVSEWYRERLSRLPGVRLMKQQKHVRSNYAYFPVIFEEEAFGTSRNEVYDRLVAEGIFTRKYFYPLTSMYDCYQERFDTSLTPVALGISNRVLTLPMYGELLEKDVDRICDVIVQMCR
ncbi:MAG: DegT/DnrJ/EryC1/StrS family aminotransferase [Eubacterium sp.]|nr:DegT/DnrJ/EryC1/StrS family aminotransferase [Eubacterium sp.]